MILPLLFKLAIGLLALSILLFLAGFGSSNWFVFESPLRKFTFGLWTICFEGKTCVSMDEVLGGTPGHAYVGRVGGIGQLVGAIVCLVMLLLFCCKEPRPQWGKIAYIMAFFAGIIGFLGAVVFIGREKASDTYGYEDVSWSGILVILAAFMQIAVGVCVLLPIKKGQVEMAQV